MRAARLDSSGTFAVTEVDSPTPDPDQVLVEVAACGICGTDIHLRRAGMVGPDTTMGHECSGTVVAMGERVGGHELGERVAVMPYLPCRACDACKRGLPQVCMAQYTTGMGLGPRPGGLAELVAVWPDQLFVLPDNVPTVAGALAEPLAVGMHGVERSGIDASASAVVMGGGSIGVMTAHALRIRGVGEFVVSEPSETRRGMLDDLGFETVHPSRLGVSVDSPDVVFDTTGVGSVLNDAVGLVRAGGIVVMLGVVEHPTQIHPFQWILKEIEVRAAMAYGNRFADAVRALGDGGIDIESLASTRMPLERTEEAFSLLASTEAPPKILIVP